MNRLSVILGILIEPLFNYTPAWFACTVNLENYFTTWDKGNAFIMNERSKILDRKKNKVKNEENSPY